MGRSITFVLRFGCEQQLFCVLQNLDIRGNSQ
jgi:hypothetical protein